MAENEYVLNLTGSQIDDRLEVPLSISEGGTGNIVRRESVTVTPDTSKASGHNISVFYFPYLRMCFARGYCQLPSGTEMTANTFYSVCSIDYNYAPTYVTILSASTSNGARCRIIKDSEHSTCTIDISPYNNVSIGSSSTGHVYFSGWWLVPDSSSSGGTAGTNTNTEND